MGRDTKLQLGRGGGGLRFERYLAVVTVCQYPVLLRRVEEQAQDMEVNGVLFKGCAFI